MEGLHVLRFFCLLLSVLPFALEGHAYHDEVINGTEILVSSADKHRHAVYRTSPLAVFKVVSLSDRLRILSGRFALLRLLSGLSSRVLPLQQRLFSTQQQAAQDSHNVVSSLAYFAPKGPPERLTMLMENVQNVQYLIHIGVGHRKDNRESTAVSARRLEDEPNDVPLEVDSQHAAATPQGTPQPRRLELSHNFAYHWEQNFCVVPDTGSYDTWFPGADCQGCRALNLYDPTQSQTSEALGELRRLSYGDATTVIGEMMRDSFVVRGKEGPIEAVKQLFLRVVEFKSSVVLAGDGILGLAHHPPPPSRLLLGSEEEHQLRDWAHDDKSTASRPSFITSFFAQHENITRQFAFFLVFHEDHDFQSQFIIGKADLSMYTKEGSALQFSRHSQAPKRRQWLVHLQSIGLEGFPRSDPGLSAGDHAYVDAALVDSGTSLLILSRHLYDFVISQLIEAKICLTSTNCKCPPFGSFPLSSAAPPNINFHFTDGSGGESSSFTLCLSPQEYLMRTSQYGSCRPAFDSGMDTLPYSAVLGMVFMRSYFTVFDVENQRVGFARSIAAPLDRCNGAPSPAALFYLSIITSILSFVCIASVLACCIFPLCLAGYERFKSSQTRVLPIAVPLVTNDEDGTADDHQTLPL